MDGAWSPPLAVEGPWSPAQRRSVRNKLQLHFQSNKRSGGGECRVEVEDGAPRAALFFREHHVRERVLARTDHQITVDGRPVRLTLTSAAAHGRDPLNPVPPPQRPASGHAHPDSETAEPDKKDGASAAAGADGDAGGTAAVLLDNVGAAMSPDLLAALVESVSGSDEDGFLLEMVWTSSRAVVTFSRAADAERFLAASPTSAKLQKHGLTARPLEAPTSVRVEDVPPTVIRELLELYFEKEWAEPGDITMIPEEQAAVVAFTHPGVVRSVCQKTDHVIGSIRVKVYPYYRSLGTALYGAERPAWKLPEPVSEPVHPAVLHFLRAKSLLESLDDRMRPHFCGVQLGGGGVATLSAAPGFLRQPDLTEQRVRGWTASAQAAFRSLMSEYAAFECAAPAAAWREAERDVRSAAKEDAVLVFDASRALLAVAGRLEDVERIRPSVESAVQKAVSDLERRARTISEAMTLSPAWFYMLKQDGLHSAAAAASPQMALAYDDGAQQLTLTGLPEEVYKTKSWILESNSRRSRKDLDLHPSLLAFLTKVDAMDMSQDLFTSQGISAVYTVHNAGVSLLGSSDRILLDAERKMAAALSLQTVEVEDWEVVRLPGWTLLIQQLVDTYNSARKKTVAVEVRPPGAVTVAGFVNPVAEVSGGLRDFVRDRSRVQDSLRLQSCAVVQFLEKRKVRDWTGLAEDHQVSLGFDPDRRRIVLAGARLHVQKAKSRLTELAGTLVADTLVVDKPGAKKYFQASGSLYLSTVMAELGCVVALRPDVPDEDEEDDDDDDDRGGNGDCYCSVRTAGGVAVSVRRADICGFPADAVVNAANEELRHMGGLALALVRAAGPQLQKESDDLIAKNGKLRPGDAVLTGAHGLPCRFVVHAVGPRYADSDRKTAVWRLRTAVQESLRRAEEAGCSSVALPAVSAGVFGFPLQLCAETIGKALRDFCDRPRGPRALTEIHLVDNNDNTVQVLAAAVGREFSDLGPTLTAPRRAAGGQRGRGKGRGQTQSDRGHQVSERGGGGGAGPGAGFHGNREGQSLSGNAWSQESERHGGSSRMQQTTAEGLRMVLRRGNIQDQTTDVLVNTVSDDLTLSRGAVSQALLEAAGPGLQAAVRREAGASRLPYGRVVVTDGGNLSCRKVFHAVCPIWNNGGGQEEEELASIIRYCLEQAEKLRMSSLSFPAIGTGNQGFPRRLVSRLLLSHIRAFSRRAKPHHLKEVALVVHPGDSQTVDCFIREFSGQTGSVQQEATESNRQAAPQASSQPQQASASFSQVSSPSLGVYRMQLRQLTLEVSSGDITKDTSDVIVNSSNQNFSLKTGVSKAILDGAGPTVEMECARIVSSPGYRQRPMILTTAGKLPSKSIIHVVGQNDPARIRDLVSGVLKLSEENRFSSVSFPALGTGQGGVNPSAVADAMVDSVVEFVRKKQPRFVRSVKILIFQAAMMAEFHRSMKRRGGEGAEGKSVFSKLKDTVLSILSGHSEAPLLLEPEEFEPTVFQLCADDEKVIRAAKAKIQKLIVDEQGKRTIADPSLGLLSPEDMEQLKALQRKLTVSIRLERDQEDQEPRIHLEGLTRDVLIAESDIREILRKVERTENRRKEAQQLSGLVEWRFLDPGGVALPFDVLTNLSLEEALERGQSVKLQIDDVKLTADPQLRKAESADGRHQVELLRKDLRDPLPAHWEDMQDSLLKLLPVPPGSTEFSDVEQEVTKTGFTPNIVKVERVQNPTLWRSYQLLKKQLEAKNRHGNNELLLFHGTDESSVHLINGRGFNRSYAGAHGAVYGNGSYFAVDPAYSARGYAKPDAGGLRRMYRARVLVGDYSQGRAGLVTPPAKSADAADLYDSVTDSTARPTMFVVFNDIQAYPEYLITFT